MFNGMRSHALKLASLLALLLVALPAEAQDSTATLWTKHSIKSDKLREERDLYVALPNGYASAPLQSYAVLILLDANDAAQFNAAIGNMRFLANNGAIPGLILVGIPNGKDRMRDLTPPATGKTAKDFPTAGGADAFADFIRSEVLPLVRANYRTRPTTVLAGHSAGGLTALHVAANRPGEYAGIIAMSPSLWWNDSTAALQYADAIGRSRVRQRIFATSGRFEEAIDITTKRFAARLESHANTAVAFSYRHYPEDTHGLTPQPSLVDGLRFVFAPIATSKLAIYRLTPSSDSAALARAIVESEIEYARGARLFGEPEKLPEPELNQMGYNVLQGLKLPRSAVSIFRRNAELYPESANVYDSLADGLLAAGDTVAAISELRKAVQIGTRTGDPVTPVSRDKLSALEKAAAQASKAKP